MDRTDHNSNITDVICDIPDMHVYHLIDVSSSASLLQDQYQLCYRAALEYLGSFDHYAT